MKESFYSVKGHPGFVKNPKTGTILNVNVREIEGARKRKRKRKEMESEITDLRSQVEHLTSIIEQLVEK
jgi:hypothetical protein